MTKLKIGGKYSFNTIAPITLNNYNNVTLTGIIDYDLAVQFEDVIGIHEKVKEEVGTDIGDITNSSFYVFKSEVGKLILADKWIVLDSVKTIDKVDITFTVSGVEETDAYVIENLLRKAGYLNVKVISK